MGEPNGWPLKVRAAKATAVGFAVTVLQLRLASSPEAIFQSLAQRRRRLEDKASEVKGSAAHHCVAQPRVNRYESSSMIPMKTSTTTSTISKVLRSRNWKSNSSTRRLVRARSRITA